MKQDKKYLIALGENSAHFSSESVKTWNKHGIDIVFAENDRNLVNLCSEMDFTVAFLESSFCPNSIRLLDWGVRNTNASWVYSIRGEFLQSLSQLALQKGAKCVLHEPKTVELLLLRLGLDQLRRNQNSVASDPYIDRINLAIEELKSRGSFRFKSEIIAPDRFERRHAEWTTFIKSSNANAEQSFTGFDSYQDKYARLLRNLSATIDDIEVSFVTLRPRSILDKSNSGIRVLVSSHERESSQDSGVIPLENHSFPEVMHTVRTQEAVVIRKEIKGRDGEVSKEYSASIPIRDSNKMVTGVLLARRNAESIDAQRFIRNTFDLSSFAPKLQRPFQCLEYFSRIYGGKAA